MDSVVRMFAHFTAALQGMRVIPTGVYQKRIESIQLGLRLALMNDLFNVTVRMKTRSGLIWLAMEISTATGDHYHANPEEVIRKWQRDSYRALWQTPLFLIVALVVIPWAVSLKFKT